GREIVKLGGNPVWRDGVVTDNGNWIIDVHGWQITDPVGLEEKLNQLPGIVTVGLFAPAGRRGAGRRSRDVSRSGARGAPLSSVLAGGRRAVPALRGGAWLVRLAELDVASGVARLAQPLAV